MVYLFIVFSKMCFEACKIGTFEITFVASVMGLGQSLAMLLVLVLVQQGGLLEPLITVRTAVPFWISDYGQKQFQVLLITQTKQIVVSSGYFDAFYVIFVPLEYIPTIVFFTMKRLPGDYSNIRNSILTLYDTAYELRRNICLKNIFC